jgi:hypothetical protein
MRNEFAETRNHSSGAPPLRFSRVGSQSSTLRRRFPSAKFLRGSQLQLRHKNWRNAPSSRGAFPASLRFVGSDRARIFPLFIHRFGVSIDLLPASKYVCSTRHQSTNGIRYNFNKTIKVATLHSTLYFRPPRLLFFHPTLPSENTSSACR